MLKTQPEMKTIYHYMTAFELTLDAEDNEKRHLKIQQYHIQAILASALQNCQKGNDCFALPTDSINLLFTGFSFLVMSMYAA